MIMRGETMQALIGTRHEVNITYPTFDEAAGGTVGLPASEPASATFSYTVATATHLPVLDAAVGYQNTGIVMCSGLNITASAQTLSYRILKNTVSLATGTLAITASLYWTAHLVNAGLLGLVNGDVIDIKLWTTGTSLLDWRWNGFAVIPTRIRLFNDARRLAFNVVFTDGNIKYPVPTLGGLPTLNSTPKHVCYGLATTSNANLNMDSNTVYYLLKEEATYGIFRGSYSDNNPTCSVVNHASRNPAYNSAVKVTKIQWNELDMRI
jgi:hypothetical protein